MSPSLRGGDLMAVALVGLGRGAGDAAPHTLGTPASSLALAALAGVSRQAAGEGVANPGMSPPPTRFATIWRTGPRRSAW